MDYRSDESIPEKRKLIEEAYGDTVPDYLLFHLGRTTQLTDDDEELLNATFFDGRAPGFGDKELHRSNGFSGSYLRSPPRDFKPFVALRIRGATRMAYSIEIGGHTCHLIQVSNGDNSKPIINFLERWGPSPEDLRLGEGDDSDSIPTPRDPWGSQTAFVENTVAIGVTPSGPVRQSMKAQIGRFIDWLLG
jgi:hypothetical protein